MKDTNCKNIGSPFVWTMMGAGSIIQRYSNILRKKGKPKPNVDIVWGFTALEEVVVVVISTTTIEAGEELIDIHAKKRTARKCAMDQTYVDTYLTELTSAGDYLKEYIINSIENNNKSEEQERRAKRQK